MLTDPSHSVEVFLARRSQCDPATPGYLAAKKFPPAARGLRARRCRFRCSPTSTGTASNRTNRTSVMRRERSPSRSTGVSPGREGEADYQIDTDFYVAMNAWSEGVAVPHSAFANPPALAEVDRHRACRRRRISYRKAKGRSCRTAPRTSWRFQYAGVDFGIVRVADSPLRVGISNGWLAERVTYLTTNRCQSCRRSRGCRARKTSWG